MGINQSCSATHPGRWREKNEDSLFCCQELVQDASLLSERGYLFALADGLGGHAAGEVASVKAMELLPYFYYFEEGESDDPGERLRWAIERVHAGLQEFSRSSFQYQGMGTTLSAIVIRDGLLYVGHVGDSRIYVINAANQSIEQLTQDHTVVARALREGSLTPEEARGENRSVLYQAVGRSATVSVEAGAWALKEGEIVLLCSDGLTDMVGDEEIRESILAAEDPARAAARLIERANGNGGEDNVTVIVIEIVDSLSPEIFHLGRIREPNPADTDARIETDEEERPGEPQTLASAAHRGARPWRASLSLVLLFLFLGLLSYAFYLYNGGW